MDGNSVPGAVGRGGRAVHLLAAMDHTDGPVLAQRQVDDPTKDISGFQPLLAGLDLAGVAVTADAVHTQREAAEVLVTHKQADYGFIVKDSSPDWTPSYARCHGVRSAVLDRTRDQARPRGTSAP